MVWYERKRGRDVDGNERWRKMGQVEGGFPTPQRHSGSAPGNAGIGTTASH